MNIQTTKFPEKSSRPSLTVMELDGYVACVALRNGLWVVYEAGREKECIFDSQFLNLAIDAAETWLLSKVVSEQGISDFLKDFLNGIDSGEKTINGDYLKGIITKCDEIITEEWKADNNIITGEMYAAALFQEATRHDRTVVAKQFFKDGIGNSIKILAFTILELCGHKDDFSR